MDYPNYYRYIAVFAYYDDGISVTFPDLSGCVSFGKDEEEAMKCAKEVLMLHMWGIEQDGDPVPSPSGLRDIALSSGEMPVMIEVFMPSFREKQSNRFVKKTLSIPYWLNLEAENRGVNFSKVLQRALMEQLDVSR